MCRTGRVARGLNTDQNPKDGLPLLGAKSEDLTWGSSDFRRCAKPLPLLTERRRPHLGTWAFFCLARRTRRDFVTALSSVARTRASSIKSQAKVEARASHALPSERDLEV